MRRSLVLEAWLAAPAEEALEAIRRVLHRPPPAPGSGSTVDPLRDAILDVLSGRDPQRAAPYELLRSLYERAHLDDDPFVLQVLRSSRPLSPEPVAGETGVPRAIADLPLGVKRSLARGDDPNLLEKLALDPDPLVIRHLLLNPRTREDDVLRIASRRPASESSLVEIHRSARWITRTRVRVALARNPGCPTDIAVRALGGVPLGDLRDVARDGTLRPELRAWAEREVERRVRDEG